MNGIDFRYLYSKKPIFFDPILMLREYNQRIKEVSVQHLILVSEREELNSNFIKPAETDLPSVICQCAKNGRELKVSRFTLKEGALTLSFYLFEDNGVPFGSFLRKYDYGSKLMDSARHLASLSQGDLDFSSEKWLSTGKHGEQLFLEKFGHTQTWYFTDPEIVNFWREY